MFLFGPLSNSDPLHSQLALENLPACTAWPHKIRESLQKDGDSAMLKRMIILGFGKLLQYPLFSLTVAFFDIDLERRAREDALPALDLRQCSGSKRNRNHTTPPRSELDVSPIRGNPSAYSCLDSACESVMRFQSARARSRSVDIVNAGPARTRASCCRCQEL